MPSMAHASLGTDDAERRDARAMTNASSFRGMNEVSGGRCVKVKIYLGGCGCATQQTPDPCEGRVRSIPVGEVGRRARDPELERVRDRRATEIRVAVRGVEDIAADGQVVNRLGHGRS